MLTAGQLATIKADIEANADLNQFPNTPDGSAAIASAYAADSSPAFIVWRNFVPVGELVDATTFTELIVATQGQRDIYRTLIDLGSVDPSKPNTRQAFADIFAAGTSSRAALLEIGKRTANRIEALLATGDGTDANPGTMQFVGTISGDEITTARNS